MGRAVGYYWVQQSPGEPWQVAHFDGDDWFLIGNEVPIAEPEVIGAFIPEPTP